MKIDCVTAAARRPFANILSRRGVAILIIAAIGTAVPAPSFAEGVLVSFKDTTAPGTIVVRTNERRLYLVLGDGQAIRYKVGVRRANRQWSGISQISGKYLKPNWVPPSEVRRDKPVFPK